MITRYHSLWRQSLQQRCMPSFSNPWYRCAGHMNTCLSWFHFWHWYEYVDRKLPIWLSSVKQPHMNVNYTETVTIIAQVVFSLWVNKSKVTSILSSQNLQRVQRNCSVLRTSERRNIIPWSQPYEHVHRVGLVQWTDCQSKYIYSYQWYLVA